MNLNGIRNAEMKINKDVCKIFLNESTTSVGLNKVMFSELL